MLEGLSNGPQGKMAINDRSANRFSFCAVLLGVWAFQVEHGVEGFVDFEGSCAIDRWFESAQLNFLWTWSIQRSAEKPS